MRRFRTVTVSRGGKVISSRTTSITRSEAKRGYRAGKTPSAPTPTKQYQISGKSVSKEEFESAKAVREAEAEKSFIQQKVREAGKRPSVVQPITRKISEQYQISGKPVSKQEFLREKSQAEAKAKTIFVQQKVREGGVQREAVKVMTPAERIVTRRMVEERERKRELARRFQAEMQKKRELRKRPFLERLKTAMKQPYDEKAFKRTTKFMTEPITKAKDYVGGATGIAWLEWGRPTAHTGEEIKQAFAEVKQQAIPKKFISFDPKESAWFGIPYIHGIEGAKTRFQYGSIQKAGEFRESGKQVTARVEKDIEQIEKSISKIKTLPDIELEEESKRFARHQKALEQSISEFSGRYGERELLPEEFERATKEQKALEKRRAKLKEIGIDVTRLQEVREAGIEKEEKRLKTYGITTKETKEGIIFTSTDLEKKVLPVHWKVQETLKSPEGKLTWKNIAYGGGAVAVEGAKLYAGGYVLGTTGVLAKVGKTTQKVLSIGAKIQKARVIVAVPKLAKTLRVLGKVAKGTVIVGIPSAVVGSQAYTGYRYGKEVGLGKFGAGLGATVGVSQLVGFGLGGYKGTKLYYKRLEADVLKGAYTKGYDIRKPAIIDEKGKLTKGFAEQFSRYETTIKGTGVKIKTDAELMGIYKGKIGESKVQIVSEIISKGKKPKIKRVVSYARLLESQKAIRMRIVSKARVDKGWLQRDILLKRRLLDIQRGKVVSDMGTVPAEKFKIQSYIKQLGKAKRIEEFPKTFFDEGELFRFKYWKGQERIFPESQWVGAKPVSIFETKQLTLFGVKKPYLAKIDIEGVGTLDIGKEATIRRVWGAGRTKGITPDILKDIIKYKFIKAPKYKIQVKEMGKKAELILQRPQLESPLVIKKLPVRKPSISISELKTPLEAFHLLELKARVPKIISKTALGVTPLTIPATATALGVKQIIKTRIKTKEIQKQMQIQEIAQIRIAKLKQIPTLKQISQMKLATEITPIQEIQPIHAQVQTPIISTKLITRIKTPTVTTPTPTPTIIPTVPVVPTVPLFPFFFLLGEKEKKKRLKERIKRKYLSYGAGFTAKMVGITKSVTEAHLRKIMRMKFTGLEIRPQLIIQRKRRRK